MTVRSGPLDLQLGLVAGKDLKCLENAQRCKTAFPKSGREGLPSPALGLTVCMTLSQHLDPICGLGLFIIAQDLMTVLEMERCGKILLYSVSGETQLCVHLCFLFFQ